MIPQGTYSVDRIEGDVTVLVSADGTTYDVMLSNLPDGVEERMMLRYEDGVFTPDSVAQKQQVDRIKALQDRLRKRK